MAAAAEPFLKRLGPWAAPGVEFLLELDADQVRHSGRSFLDHLIAVAGILQRWGARREVVLAGLFHSIYGTEYFRHRTLGYADRPRVRELLGAEAEHLAWRFCTFVRDSLAPAVAAGPPYHVTMRGGGPVDIPAREIADLCAIVWANLLEQKDRMPVPPPLAARLSAELNDALPHLPEAARPELEAAFARGPAMRPSRLAALLNLDDPGAFLADAGWTERMHLANGPLERLIGLCDYDFDQLVRMNTGYTRAFFRTREQQTRWIDLPRGQESAAYEAGGTIYFHGIQDARLKQWTDELDEELGLITGLTRVSAFASLRGQGLTPHYDLNDNFVCQAQGKKRWRIAPNIHVKHPLYGYTAGKPITPAHRAEAPDGLPEGMPDSYQVVEMTAGTVMFMPRGMWHDTETTDEVSLHFNLQSGMPTWRDLIDFCMSRTPISVAAELRGPILAMFEGGAVRAGVKEELVAKLETLLAAVRGAGLELRRDELCRYVALRRTKLFEYPY